MADLFTSIETEQPKKKVVSKPRKNLFKVFYKGGNGRFSDKETARIAQIENENRVFKSNWYYWKRQAERLRAEYFTEHENFFKLEEENKRLIRMNEFRFLESSNIINLAHDTATKPTSEKMATAGADC